jgi:sigma-B regulation protein RsbU (phosphoserine phosphatase)
VNRQLHTASLADRFATLFYGVFDAATHTLRYASAGHNPPLVIRRNGSVAWLEAGGLPLGLFTNSPYEQDTIQLEPGDTVIAYTDGVIEATNASTEEWGVAGLRRAALESGAQSADGLVDAIFAALEEFSGGRQSDDATVVVLQAR